MKRLVSILSACALMTLVLAAMVNPAMADVNIRNSGGSHGHGFTSIISSSNFGGFDNDDFGDSSDNFVFFSSGSSFGDIDIEGSNFDFD